MDVGVEKPDTILSTNFTLINFLNCDNCLTKMLYLSYKAYLLDKNIDFYIKNAQSLGPIRSKSVQISLSRCLQELKSDIEKASINNIYYSKKKHYFVYGSNSQLSDNLYD